jgi:ABC-type Fe3+-hydroxamate transport system substrate-binding protein
VSYVNRKQNDQIAELKAEIEALKARVAALEKPVVLVPWVKTTTPCPAGYTLTLYNETR